MVIILLCGRNESRVSGVFAWIPKCGGTMKIIALFIGAAPEIAFKINPFDSPG
jgi:hypothetical protein